MAVLTSTWQILTTRLDCTSNSTLRIRGYGMKIIDDRNEKYDGCELLLWYGLSVTVQFIVYRNSIVGCVVRQQSVLFLHAVTMSPASAD